MKFLKISIYSLMFVIAMASCRKDDAVGNVDNISGLGGDSVATTAIDTWIHDNYVVPHNIDVKYRWNQFTVNQIDKNVVPPKESVVIPVMAAVHRIWAAPYVDEIGLTFFNQISPKYFVLAGSSAANPDGTATVGVAGGGRQINLFQLNYFKNKTTPGYTLADTSLQKDIFLTVHHEFSHIFDQLKRRTREFDLVTQTGYSTAWYNYTDEDKRQEGFITAYASSAAAEDFAEMISFMLVYGKPGWDELVAGIGEDFLGTFYPNYEAQDLLHKKEDAIVNYFDKSWGIDFYSLQSKVRASIENEFY
jgi:substrate import-associated zinc metallohydrolase lipoprotein